MEGCGDGGRRGCECLAFGAAFFDGVAARFLSLLSDFIPAVRRCFKDTFSSSNSLTRFRNCTTSRSSESNRSNLLFCRCLNSRLRLVDVFSFGGVCTIAEQRKCGMCVSLFELRARRLPCLSFRLRLHLIVDRRLQI